MNAAGNWSTPHQRLAIRCELQAQDLPLQTVTLMHKRAFRSAGLPEPTPGADLDGVLCGLTKLQASRLIDALRNPTRTRG